MDEISIQSKAKIDVIDITPLIQRIVSKSGVKDGICCIYAPHTTAGIFINENADPSVIEDIKDRLRELIPPHINYKHLEGNSPAHIGSSFIGVSEVVIIEGGKLALGTWQGIFFYEMDGPRRRRVWVKIIASKP